MSEKRKTSGLAGRIALVAALVAAMFCASVPVSAKKLNDKVQNRPYADMRRFHLGFSVGMNTFGMSFHHNGFVTDQGQTWFMLSLIHI